MSGIAEVLLEHRVTRTGRCSCGATLVDVSPERIARHAESALVGAGFGLVREAHWAGAALGWDAAVSRMTYEDGTPVEIAANVNPYRAASD